MLSNIYFFNPRYSGEDQRLIFDRDDIVVNQEHEERVISHKRARTSRRRTSREKSNTPEGSKRTVHYGEELYMFILAYPI